MTTSNQDHPAPRRLWKALTALVLGFGAGICAHYVLYRLSLPSAPFIYVAF